MRYEWKRYACERDGLHDAADVEKRLDAEAGGDSGGNGSQVVVGRAFGDADAGNH